MTTTEARLVVHIKRTGVTSLALESVAGLTTVAERIL
jgi:hypothetical protein